MATLREIKKAEALQTFVFPLIVPTEEEVLTWKESDFAKSALNACYSKPVRNEKTGRRQSWYEVELTVESKEDLPSRKEWFYLATDDGRYFKACFIGRKIKKLRTIENKELLGAWIKYRLIEAELVDNFRYVYIDRKRLGVITKEMLQEYGNDQIFLKRTDKTRRDEVGIKRYVWFLSFPSKIRWLIK